MDNCQNSICNRRNLNLLRDRGRQNIAAMPCTSQPDMDLFDCGYNNSNIYMVLHMATGIPDTILFEMIRKWDGTVCVQLKLHTANFINSVLNSSACCSQMFPISHRNRSCISWCHVQRTQQHVWFFVFFSAQTSSTNISTNTLSKLESVGKRWSPEARTS